jgi:hypothetical protein
MTGDHHKLYLVLELGQKKTFASAFDWPGWSRSGKTEAAAIEGFIGYRERYNQVVALAGFDPIGDEVEVGVVDRLPGDATTGFGVPVMVHAVEHEAMSEAECERQVALLQACWRHFGETAATTTPELRKGPRGGGRDRDKLRDHVVQADRGYARRISVRTPPFDSLDADAAPAHHDAVFAAIPGLRNGEVADKGWPVHYAIRRMAWHVLDHAWEMQDKDLSGKAAS